MRHRLFGSSPARLLAIFLALLPHKIPAAEISQPVQPIAPSPGKLPPSLEPWTGWVNWDKNDSPAFYNNAERKISFWPARLGLEANAAGGLFDLSLEVFHTCWVPLPGEEAIWPLQVTANGKSLPVVWHENAPSVRLEPGEWRLKGVFQWKEIPQRIALPKQIGMLALQIDGKPVETPAWKADGNLFLKRDQVSVGAEKNFLGVKIYRVIEDGIPTWLRTQIELSVSGASREIELGGVLPAGWSLATVTSNLPTQIDAAGRMKAQIRAGKWIIQLDSFRSTPLQEIGYASGVKPAVDQELVAYQSKPEFRLAEVTDIPSVDVSQTTFPEKWKSLPVYAWETKSPFQLVERQRGAGLQKPEGLHVNRQMWLDQTGAVYTFRDRITGTHQKIWRLDSESGQQVGSVQNAREGLLVTLNPDTQLSGVEIRDRNLDLTATGQINRTEEIPAVGWQTDADSLEIGLQLPPGWRLLALFGADTVDGDWLTSWTLLDLFLLLIFSLAVFRLRGIFAGVLAFIGFGISFHEVGAPRYLWLALLIPVALIQVIPAGKMIRPVQIWKWLTVLALIFVLVPFVAHQVQICLYPQLEFGNFPPGNVAAFSEPISPEVLQKESASSDYESRKIAKGWGSRSERPSETNMVQLSTARIQTGPGIPEWSWRPIKIKWNGPVQAGQKIHPILISMPTERLLTLLRVVLLLVLAGVLIGVKKGDRFFGGYFGKKGAAVLLTFLAMTSPHARADFPDKHLLSTLRDRLNPVSDAFPKAAEIPTANLEIIGNRLILNAEIHAATTCAIPLPGRVAAWAPISVTLDGKTATAIRREDGYVWVVVPEGVHQIHAEGMFPGGADWEWAFALKPHHLSINAPEWNVSGLNTEGVPESQIFFSLKQKASANAASYDRQALQSIALVERKIEMGLVWQVHTTVRRLSPKGSPIELMIPLLPGERVLSATQNVQASQIAIRLGTNEEMYSWESELEISDSISLRTAKTDSWIERWTLQVSPIWNLKFSGIAPQFQESANELIPVWTPWPGERVEWKVNRPLPEKGTTVSVDRVNEDIAIGKRQRVVDLIISVRSSLGEDFTIGLPPEAEVTNLTRGATNIPVRMDEGNLVFPLQPGAQEVQVKWKNELPLQVNVRASAIRLPVESANVNVTMHPPENRWVLWTAGPLRGPAVRFWGVLICTLIAGWILGRIRLTPLKSVQWMLLVVGLTQVSLPESLIVIAWLFLLAWRGTELFQKISGWVYNLSQILIVGFTAASLAIFIEAVGAGLLGSPRMFILGNGSTANNLQWYQDRCGEILPQPGFISVSIWWYRLLMLAWALWLAVSLLKWLWWGWRQFVSGGVFRRATRKSVTPPPIPGSSAGNPNKA